MRDLAQRLARGVDPQASESTITALQRTLEAEVTVKALPPTTVGTSLAIPLGHYCYRLTEAERKVMFSEVTARYDDTPHGALLCDAAMRPALIRDLSLLHGSLATEIRRWFRDAPHLAPEGEPIEGGLPPRVRVEPAPINAGQGQQLARQLHRLFSDIPHDQRSEPPYHFVIGNDEQLAQVLTALGHTVECHG